MKYKVHSILSFLLLILSFTIAKSATIKGHVTDSISKETLIGATIFIKDNTQLYDVAGLEGSYSIKALAPGSYTVIAQFFGYIVQEKSVVIADAQQIVTLDFFMTPQALNLGQVKIIGTYDKGSDNYARSAEKNADYVMNIVSAKTIQLSPDITIGDVLQRVSGITVEKSVTGGGKYAVIRGMDKRYNYTTINGVKVPSPDYKNRYVPMDIFPSEILERLEVIKTLTPDMEGDAIGGAMNLVLKDAPDQFTFTTNLATGYDQTLFNNKYNQFDASVINPNSPNEVNGSNYRTKASDFPLGAMTYTPVTVLPNILAGATIGNRLLLNKLGILFSVSYQNTFSATQGFFIKAQSQPLPAPTFNTPEWDYVSSRYYSTQQRREAAHLKLDYEFNKKHKISLYTVYAGMNQYRSRIEDDTLNSIKGSELDPLYETKVTYQHIFSTILQGIDTLAHNLFLEWTAAYSDAWANTPDWTTLNLIGAVGLPASDAKFSTLSMVWMQNSDQDFSGYANLTYRFKMLGQNIAIKGGAMNRDKSRDAFYAEYDMSALTGQPNFTNINVILSNPSLYRFSDTTGSPQNANTYSVQEDIMAYYIMAKINLGSKIEMVGGERVEVTNQSYQTQLPVSDVGQYGAKQYTDFLPSIEIKYSINTKQAIRASYFASISRPSFFEIVPYSIAGDEYNETGNPYLLHTVANNYDLRYEFFPTPSEQILAGAFYKQIYNPIEYAVLRGAGPSSTLVQPINIGGDTGAPVINYGFEFVITKYFKHFGISANYTYTHSRVTVPVQKYFMTPSGEQRSDTTETRPMQGQADNIANISLLYKEPKIGLEAQVSVVYTGKSISDVSLWYGLDLWQMPMTKIDLSFEKRLSKKLKITLYGKANNLLNTPLIIRMFPPNPYQNIPGVPTPNWLSNQDVSRGNLNSIIVEKQLYGQSYLLGIRYKF